MSATPFKTVSFTSESITQAKMQQMANNEQWLFENMTRLRYTTTAVTRDQGLKVISGKTFYARVDRDYLDVHVYFGSFFSAGCRPVVIANGEYNTGLGRRLVTTRGLSGEIDHRGFVAHVTAQDNWTGAVNRINTDGWIHWMAVGY